MDQRLTSALQFDEVDLAANRSGRLTDRQRARLTGLRRKGNVATLVMGLVTVGFIVVVAIVVVPKLRKNVRGSTPTVPIVVAVLALIALAMMMSILRSRRSLGRLTSGSVRRVSGITRTRARRIRGNVGDPATPTAPYGGGVRYEVTIGRTRFIVAGRAVLDAFVDGAQYTGYYVGKGFTAVLLSADPAR